MFEKEVPFSFKALCVLKSAYKLSGVFSHSILMYYIVGFSFFLFFFWHTLWAYKAQRVCQTQLFSPTENSAAELLKTPLFVV